MRSRTGNPNLNDNPGPGTYGMKDRRPTPAFSLSGRTKRQWR